MKVSTAVPFVVMLTLLSAATLPAMACGPPDMKTHVGKVLSVDKKAGTLTLLDAESLTPITFTADGALLDKASRTGGRVAVTYETIGDTLRALDLK